ncbi:hypothetical protein B0T21DRAFT_445152 [Apiosordaria backusii]|uniref:Uncharacterized protein n=1 Tax=Apiosordaria backusii TaxID=314023 RepID=A0AA40B7T2_9PEZI|nr:hypothetical protein B0T21DRAFT_445152 [Apiosordaria backusii]
MEPPPPAKRPRLLGPLGTEEEEDPLEDELLSLPSEVNARRDPNLKLERSRQHAVFKLKSAFESIFERYGRDFEGVGDEIDLRTGRIVVNNGHIEGLRGSDLLEGEDGEDEDEDGVGDEVEGEGDKEELNDEKRILQGGREVDENRLSRLGGQEGLGMVGMPQMGYMGPQMGFNGFGGWPGMMGGQPPGLSNMMFPGQMGGPFGGFGTDYGYGPPMNLQTSDPTWQAPALPPSYMYRPGATTTAVTVKKKRMSLIAPREDQGDNEDDVLLGVSAEGSGKAVTETPIKQKLLVPKPPPDTGSTKKKRGPGRPKTKIGSDTPKQPAQKHEEENTTQKSSPREDVVMGESDGTPSKTTSAARADVETVVEDSEPLPAKPELSGTATRNDSAKGLEMQPTVVAVRSRPPTVKDPIPADDTDLYIYMSDSEQKSARKPQNQSLRVEIVAKRPIDVTSFRAITPEQSEAESPILQSVGVEQSIPTRATETLALEEKGADQPARPPTPESEKETEAQPKPPEEVFTRHVVDTEYDFSDEDESMPRRKKQPQKKAEASRRKDENLLRKTLRKPLSIVASETKTTSERPHEDAPMPEAQNLIPQDVSLEDQANCEGEHDTEDSKEPSPQPAPRIINTEASILDVMVQPPDISEVVYRIGNEETPWPKRRARSSFRGRDPRGEIPDSDPIGGFSTQDDLDDNIRPPSPSLSFHGEEDTALEIPDSYPEPSSELGIPEAEPRRDHTIPSPTLSSYAPTDEILEPIPFLSSQAQGDEVPEPASGLSSQPPNHEISKPTPSLPTQSHDDNIPETISSPPLGTQQHYDDNNVLESIEHASSPLIPKPAQAKQDFQPKLATPSSTTPVRRPRGRPSRTKSRPAAKPSTTPVAKSTTTTTATKPTTTPATKPTKTPTSKPTPTPASTSISSTTKRKRRSGVLSLLSDSEDDELSLLTPSQHPPVTPITRSSPASHHVRLFPHITTSLKRDALLKSVSKPRQQPRKKEQDKNQDGQTAPDETDKLRKGDGFVAAAASAAAMSTNNDKNDNLGGKGTEETAGGRGEKRRKATRRGVVVKAFVSAKRQRQRYNDGTPLSKRIITGEEKEGVGEWGDLVQTPNGTVRRCGEEGFVCERAFCFRCV